MSRFEFWEGNVLIKFTKSEVECLLTSLNSLLCTKVPVSVEWKAPYIALEKDLDRIREQIIEKEREIVNDKENQYKEKREEMVEDIQKPKIVIKPGPCD